MTTPNQPALPTPSTPAVYARFTRASLGLGDLDLNDKVNFSLGADILGAGVTWRRQQVSSPYVENRITVNRVRDQVQDRIHIDVLGSTQAMLQSNLATLVTCVSQDFFNLDLRLDGNQYLWACECSDYTIDWSVPRVHSRFVQVIVTLLRSPVPIAGGV